MWRGENLPSTYQDEEIIDMRYALLTGFSGLCALVAPVPALAHHPFSAEFDAQAPLTLSGIITEVDWGNPHVYVHVDAKDPSGQTRKWTLELASPTMLTRRGWTKDSLKIGEVITTRGYRAKSEPFATAARMIELPGGKQMSAADDGDGGPK
jgi:hypothetical protein